MAVEQNLVFISGKITRCQLSTPRVVQGKNGEFNSYSLHITGFYEDDPNKTVDDWFHSTYRVKVIRDRCLIDPKETDGKEITGRICLKQVGDRLYLKAVDVKAMKDDHSIQDQNIDPFTGEALLGSYLDQH